MSLRLTILFVAALLLATSCKKEEGNQPPTKPKLLTPAKGAVVAPESINFTWEASTDADGEKVQYSIYLSNDNTNWDGLYAGTGISTTIANKLGEDSYYAFKLGEMYYWKLAAKTKDANGQYTGITESDVVSFYTCPNGVINLSKTTGNGYVNLAWTDPAGLTKVEITFSPTVIGIAQPIVVNPGVSKLELQGMQNETLYSFYVKAYNSLGHISKPDTIKAMPLSLTLIHDNEFNIYSTVQIGTQTWMRENLRATKWQDGTVMRNGWGLIYYEDPQSNVYGRYYVSPVLWEGKNPCPCGYHVPSDAEVITLERFLGMPETDLHKEGDNRGGLEKVGASIKSKTGWADYQGVSGNGLDLYGLNIVPAGYYYGSNVENVVEKGQTGNFYTTTIEEGSNFVYMRYLSNGLDGVNRWTNSSAFNGYSVRCIKD